MKKRNFALCGLAIVAGLSIAGCNKDDSNNNGGKVNSNAHIFQEAPADEKYDTDGGTVRIHLNYNGAQGITYRGDAGTTFNNAVDGINYSVGDLLPTWKTFAQKTRTTIKEASEYNGTKDNDSYKAVNTNEFKSDVEKDHYIDLFYNSTSNIQKMVQASKAVDLTSYINAGKMPNYKKYLDANPAVKEEVTYNGGIYFTPYFDSYNDVERNLVMDTTIVKTLLNDKNAAFDNEATKKNGKNGASNLITDVKYQPFINSDYNYAADTKVNVSVNGAVKEITIKKTTNIIKQQNELLEQGCTGKQLAEQFIDYLDAAFGDNIGKGKIFENRSDIFTEEQAAYNVDELVALMRVVKANPGLITGDPSKEVETLFPRGQNASRVQNILQFGQIWGVQGLVSEKDFLYYLQDGTVNDARTTAASFELLDILANLYSEGLILTDFYYLDGKADSNRYLNKYFKKSVSDYSFGLLEYDYNATQCVANDLYDGIGTLSGDSEGARGEKGYKGSVTGIKPILPPLSYWATSKDYKYNQSLFNHTNKTLIRHYDENRSIKGNSWCIPSSAENKDGAVRIMDYIFSEMGQFIQDFGPEAYWAKPNFDKGDKLAEGLTYDENKTYIATDGGAGLPAPIISTKQKVMIADSNLDFWTYMRACMGSTHGIGNVRTGAIQVQATNYYGQIGYSALERAFANGVVDLSLVDKDGDHNTGTVTWNTSVPVNNYNGLPDSEKAKEYDAVVSFWSNAKLTNTPKGWVYAVINGGWTGLASDTGFGKCDNASSREYTKADVIAEQAILNNNYLKAVSESLNSSYNSTKFKPTYIA